MIQNVSKNSKTVDSPSSHTASNQNKLQGFLKIQHSFQSDRLFSGWKKKQKQIKYEAVIAEPTSIVYNVQIFVKEIICQDPQRLSTAQKSAEISYCVWMLGLQDASWGIRLLGWNWIMPEVEQNFFM